MPSVSPHVAQSDLSAAQARRLDPHTGADASHDVWKQMQRGLPYPAPEAVFATFWHSASGLSKDALRTLMLHIREYIHQHCGNRHTSAVVGVGFARWQAWATQDGSALPSGMRLSQPALDANGQPSTTHSAVFERGVSTFADSQGDLWFHIKSDSADYCDQVFAEIARWLEAHGAIDPARTVYQHGSTKSTQPDRLGGKVLGCRFSENLNNPSDPLSIQTQALVGAEDPAHLGASFVLSQRFLINWDNILNMSPEQIEDLVGRTTNDIIVPSHDDRSHIKASRAQDAQGNTMALLRLGLPFGQSSATLNTDLRRKGATLRDEAGIYFAGYARSVQVLEAILDQQIGDQFGFLRDRLLSQVRADLGGFFYIPSQADLGLPEVPTPKRADTDWARFPGVDWSRLDRHFTQRSTNGLMYYNHKDFLYAMATMPAEEQASKLPPSVRVQLLLANTFLRWQDNWYFDRKQQELEHLSVWVERVFGTDKAQEVMALPVAERMGWAIRMTVGHAYVSEAYGFRGRVRDADGNWVNGADTYRIQPQELIVGGLPNIGLGQGKYVMDYARDDEALPNFFKGLSYASGVGHVVPGYQKALTLGLDGLKAEVNAKLAAKPDADKQAFYHGVLVALEGISEHCLAYARLACITAARLPEGMAAEKHNLHQVAARMQKLASAAPDTLVEATQLIFTLHAALHLSGEPTAIGRLDQLLQPYYAADLAAGRLDEAGAQEIIDCFWLKIGEKVQSNRLFVEDHQPFGNLAMGGSSGNYPQGAGNNQWVQQVTIGGTIADDSPGAGLPAYNDVTRLCLRAARRLPLNAPCLSLRVRPDIPHELLEEAALAILSGGAHPILLNDAAIIDGLHRSGDGVGDGAQVSQRAEGRWRSDVALSAARDYACDGCYEPQLTGLNWFTLGGLNTLVVLEAAMNQGKSWATAGPVWFRGQKVSFTSPPPEAITSYAQLEALFFQHLKWMYAKQLDGQIGGFGQLQEVCPTPLLSLFIDDCLDKGMDLYAGGARYNVIAPCFTAIPNLVNALWAIQSMVFDPATAVTSLPELTLALMCDWGYSMQEPFISTLAGPTRIAAQAERYQALRQVALSLPRYGRDHAAINAFGDDLAARIAETIVDVFRNPAASTADSMVRLAQTLGTPEQPFGGFQIQPGVGTFENYVEFGGMSGASADGRRNGETLSSDLSPTPSPADAPVAHQEAALNDVLRGQTGQVARVYSDGAPTDLCIREDYPPEQLVEALHLFAQGEGSNILTLTCANPDTLANASRDPEKFDLIRVRMGGWSEFFVSMFPAHQAQHQRRPLDVATE